MKIIRAYHVDKFHTFPKSGNVKLETIPVDFINYKVLKERYPEGLSKWGLSILSVQDAFDTKTIDLGYKDNPDSYFWNSYLIDILFEYERLVSFPSKNSRFQSIFCSDSISLAQKWMKFFPEAKLYEIEFEEEQAQLFDSSHLNTRMESFSLPFAQEQAHLYWSGGLREPPISLPELLVKLPVKVVDRIS